MAWKKEKQQTGREGEVRDKHRLGATVIQKVTVSLIGDGEDVGGKFLTALSSVKLDHLISVDGEATVRVDGDAEETRVSLNNKYERGGE